MDTNKKRIAFFIFFTIINACAFLTFNMLTAGMPAYIGHLNFSKTFIGLSTTITAIASLIFRPIISSLQCRYDKKRLLFIGIVLMIVALVPSIITNNIFVLLVLRAFQGIGWSILSATVSSLIVETSNETQIAEYIGLSGALSSLTSAIGPWLALSLLNEFGSASMFLVAIGGLFLCLLICILAFNYKNANRDTAQSSEIIFVNKSVIFPAFLIFSVTVCYSPLITFANNADFSDCGSLFLLTYAISTIIARPICGKIYDRVNGFIISIIAIASIIVSLVLFSFNYSAVLFAISGITSGVALGIGMSAWQAFAVKLNSNLEKGTAIATFLLGFDLGMAVGSGITGFLSEYLGCQLSLLLLLCFPIISIFLLPINKSSFHKC